MCLSTVDEKPRRKSGKGYKMIAKGSSGYQSFFRPYKYKVGVWLSDKNNNTLQDYQFKPYPSGYHIMTRKDTNFTKQSNGGSICTLLEPAVWTLVKLEYRIVVATQYDTPDSFWGKQVVAKEMKIIGEV